MAQIKLPSKGSEGKAPAKQVTSSKPAETKTLPAGPVLTLKVMADTDCKFYMDGDYKFSLTAGQIERINLQPGEYLFKAVSSINNNDVFKTYYTVGKNELGIQKFYEIDLKSIAAKHLKNESEEREIKEKAADEKRALENEQAAKETLKIEKEREELAFAQTIKPFKGKIRFNVNWENLPDELNKDFFKPGESTYFSNYRKDRNETRFPDLCTTTIYDYDKMETMAKTDLLALDEDKIVVFDKIKQYPDGLGSISYIDEYKTIAGYTCQKALVKNPELDSPIPCFVVRNFSSRMNGYSATNVAPFLMLEMWMPIKSDIYTLTFHQIATSVSTEPVSDALFSFDAVSTGVEIIDNRK